MKQGECKDTNDLSHWTMSQLTLDSVIKGEATNVPGEC